jgi:hypothetical protein
MRSQVAERGRDETMLGWWHSHPVRHWHTSGDETGQAGPENTGTSGEFFSADDCALHHTVFPAAYSVGMVVSDSQTESGVWGVAWTLFGWRRGAIVERGFHIIREEHQLARLPSGSDELAGGVS